MGVRMAAGVLAATFTGEFPLARIDFADPALPIRVSLEAFTPFIPHEPDESGLPVALLRYRVTNPGAVSAKVSIAWSIENPTGRGAPAAPDAEPRVNEYRSTPTLAGLLMTSRSEE